ncbi:MAG: ATP-binding domain-containing protein [Janthinobacterium lividum]
MTEITWVEREVRELITREAVEPEHILVLCATKDLCEEVGRSFHNLIVSKLIEGVILPASKPEQERDFFILQTGSLTVSTVKSAKGYEAQVVFIIGCDVFANSSEGRAEFYVGATRAKLRLYLSGWVRSEQCSETDTLMPELERVDATMRAQAIDSF